MSWTEERVETLSDLWAEGLSSGQIAVRMDVSRNTIIGKLNRLGLMGTRPIAKRDNRHGKSLGRPNGGGLVNSIMAKKAVGRKPPTLPVTEAVELMRDDVPDPVEHRHLKPGQCQWPIDETWGAKMLCCGAKSLPGEPYCETHRKRAYSGKVAAGVKPSRSRP